MDLREIKMLAGMHNHNGSGYIEESNGVVIPADPPAGKVKFANVKRGVLQGLKTIETGYDRRSKADLLIGIAQVMGALVDLAIRETGNKDIGNKLFDLSEDFWTRGRQHRSHEG